jgi:hypothetical protein
VSHPIPLHTADRLERTLEALSERVGSSGEESWVMRILAMLISRCLDHFVEMIEDLLAKIRAGTIVLPDWAYDPPAIPADDGTGARRSAPPPRAAADPPAASRRGVASRHIRAPRDTLAGASGEALFDVPGQHAARSAAVAPGVPVFTLSPTRAPIYRVACAPHGVADYRSAVPRWPAEKFAPARRVEPCSFRYDNRIFRNLRNEKMRSPLAQTEKYFARGLSTTIALVDCSGWSCHSSDIETPIRPASSRRSSGA